MKTLALAGLTLVGLLALFVLFCSLVTSRPSAGATFAADPFRNAATVAHPDAPPLVAVTPDFEPPAEPAALLLAEEKAARVAKIQRDYEDVRLDLLHGYGREGETFPGGSNALLRQFALLEREMHFDLTRVLTPRELEDLEFHDTRAGWLVQRLLSSSVVSEEQRRAVFRLQRNFDLHCGFPTDATPASFAERDRERQANDAQIRAVLGDTLFAMWIGRADVPSPSGGG